MINYNAKDLIEQATMLADLQNSDFISWKENIMFLDNAWNALYQQIINHGDKSFLKEATFEGSEWELPCDFYQLQYVSCNDRPINRKSKTETFNGTYYDIVENTLKIYNKGTVGRVKVLYFPVRDSITYASPDVVLGGKGTFVDCCDKNVLYSYKKTVEEVEKTFYGVYDIINGKDIDVEDNETPRFMIYSSGSVSDTTKPYYKVDNKAYYSELADNTLTIYKANGTPYLSIDDVEVFDEMKEQVNTFTENGIYYIKDGKLYVFDYCTKKATVYAENVVGKNVYGFNGNVYYETIDGVYCNDCCLYDASEYDVFRGVMKVDDRTGYGILFDSYVLKSAFENTELLFPNNFYYNYMAYKLAVYYKVKQNADPSGVAALAEEALKTFYDTLPKDGNEYVRISNAYTI